MSRAKTKGKSETALKCWLKFSPQHATTYKGTVTLNKPFRTPGERQGEFRRLMRYIRTLIANEKIWQARIYEQPQNQIIFAWDNMNGATTGKSHLDMIEFEMNTEEVVAELEHFIQNSRQ